VLAREKPYRCICVAFAHDALLGFDRRAAVECLLLAVLVMKAYVCIFPLKAPGQIRFRGLRTYSRPGKVSEGEEEDPGVQNRDAGAGLVEVVHQAAEYSAVEGST
jgi:hypothetical protein